MAKTEQKKFTLLDIHLAAFLELHNIVAELVNQNGRVIFVFPASDELYQLCNSYNLNISVPITDYVSVLRTLKARMLSMKGQR